MTAVILAAGIGRRLWPLTADRPKCLLPLPVAGGCTLNRLVWALELAGVDRLVCVVGYLRGEIARALEALDSDVQIQVVVNEHYQHGSVYSLYTAREHLDDEVLIVDADVLFPLPLVSRLIECELPNAFLLDPSVVSTGEEMLLMARGGRVWSIGREIDPGDWDVVGESLGLLKLDRHAAGLLKKSLVAIVERSLPLGDHEVAYRPILAEHHVGFLSVAGEPWTEIDTPDDLMMAAKSVAPRIADHERLESHGEVRCVRRAWRTP